MSSGHHITARQRAELVELLRCAADLAIRGDRYSALGSAVRILKRPRFPHLSPPLVDSHWSSLLDPSGPGGGTRIQAGSEAWFTCSETYHLWLLEAAARVEEGSWP